MSTSVRIKAEEIAEKASEYISRTNQINSRLSEILTEKGVEADASETTTALVDKVGTIEQGGEITQQQILEYWASLCVDAGSVRSNETIKNVGNLTFPYAGAIGSFFRDSKIEEVGTVTAPNASSVAYLFMNCENLLRIGGVVAKKATIWSQTFASCRKLVEITDPLDFSAVTMAGSAFASCLALEYVRFVEGSIYTSIALPNSLVLSAESVQSIVDGLADLTGGTTQTLTLRSNIVVTDEQKAAITLKNWTLVQ